MCNWNRRQLASHKNVWAIVVVDNLSVFAFGMYFLLSTSFPHLLVEWEYWNLGKMTRSKLWCSKRVILAEKGAATRLTSHYAHPRARHPPSLHANVKDLLVGVQKKKIMPVFSSTIARWGSSLSWAHNLQKRRRWTPLTSRPPRPIATTKR